MTDAGRREWAAAVIAASAVVLLRLLWHPHFLLDEETTFVNTVGRDWALGAPGAPTRLQLIVYQGSFLLDALLSSWGYRVLGDHLLAWFWVPMAYVAAFVGLGAELCRRAGGRWGLWLWTVLAAGCPFLLKDGLISIPGGHTSSVVWVLAALLALDRALAGSDRAAVVAGVFAGFAAWYTRSAVLVVAVVPVVLLAGRGRRTALRAGLGLLVLPGLLLLNGIGLTLAGPWAGSEPPADLWSRMLWNVYGLDGHEPSLWLKAQEVTGVAGWRQLFAQPPALPGEVVAGSWSWPGVVWAAAFVFAVVAAVAVLAVRLRRVREVGLLDAGASLAVLYAAAYVFSPLRIEPETFDYALAPLPTMVRYVTPAMLLLLVFIGVSLARLSVSGGWRRALAVATASILAAPGVFLALSDGSDRAPDIWEARVPYRYYRVFGAHRGLPRDMVAGWQVGDAEADRNRLQVLGTFEACSPQCLEEDPARPARSIERAARELGLSPRDRTLFVHGLGQAFADHLWSSDDVPGARLLELTLEASVHMSDRDAAAWLGGFAEVAAEDPGALGMAPEALVPTLCRVERGGKRPLCRIGGNALAFECDSTDPVPLQVDGVPPAALARAAGFRLGRDLPPWMRDACAARLPAGLRDAYGAGWESGASVRWRRSLQ